MQTAIETRVCRWVRFLEGRGEPFLFTVSFPVDCGPRPWPYQNYSERIEWAARLYDAHMRNMDRVRDDSIPCLRPYTGTEIFAEAFGCPVHFNGTDMPCARPLINDLAQVDSIDAPDLFETPLTHVFAIADKLRRVCGQDAIMKLPDIQSPMGIAAMILDKSAFLLGLFDDPERIRRLSGVAMDLLTAFLDEWFRRYGTDFVAHHPDYFMRGGLTLSDDEIGSVSTDVYAQYFLPDLTMLSRRYGGLGFHCCADSQRHWSSFLTIPELRALNISTKWLAEPDRIAREAYRFFAGRLVQIHRGRAFTGDPWTWPAQVPDDARAVFEISASSPDQATEIAERMSGLREQIKAGRAGNAEQVHAEATSKPAQDAGFEASDA